MKVTTETIVKFYEELLESIDIISTEDGLLSFKSDKTPLLLNEKRLALPTRDNLSKGTSEDILFFHPLSESISRGESDVCIKIRKLINLKLTSTIAETILALLELASDKSIHSELTPRQSKLLDIVQGANKKTVSNISSVLSKVKLGPKDSVVNIYMKRGGKINDVNYSRMAVVKFPLLELFDEPDRKVLGVPLRINDIDNFKSLFKYLLPNYEDYTVGTNVTEVPYLTALLKAFSGIAEDLNAVIEIHKEYLSEYSVSPINVDYVNRLSKVVEFRSIIPPLDGNVGVVGEIVNSNINSLRDNENTTTYNRQPEIKEEVVEQHREVERVQEPQQSRTHKPTVTVDEETDSVSFSELMKSVSPPPPSRGGNRERFYAEHDVDRNYYRDDRGYGRDDIERSRREREIYERNMEVRGYRDEPRYEEQRYRDEPRYHDDRYREPPRYNEDRYRREPTLAELRARRR